MVEAPCTVPRCGKNHHARGYCGNHHYSWLKYSDPLAVQHRMRGSVLQELEAAAPAESSDCIILAGYKTRPS
ncbi:hypothetical protein [Streptomyces mirabilis]|uniref:hypothetical protein n=1 Tax=Streptomyces mirabilis TaxID=68239 RepID=UPI0036AE67B2